jgi:hypothetical protein
MAYRKTLSDLRTIVRDFVDESTANFWSNVQLNRFIAQAQQRVWAEVRRLKDDFFLRTLTSTDGTVTCQGESYTASSFAIVAGTRDYTLPHDFATMKLIEVVTSSYESVRFVYRDLAHPDMRQALEMTTNQSPALFYYDIIGERTLRIAPKSSTALDLRITYEQTFADLSADADELTMPHPLYLAVVHYATASALTMDRDPNAAAHEARAKQIIADVFAGHARQTQDVETATSYLSDW